MLSPDERMKSAWDSANRTLALNSAVEVMAAEGVHLEALNDALLRLLLEIRASGADDETEEIVNEVADRLHGWCHVSGRIETHSATLSAELSQEEYNRLGSMK